MEPIEIAFSRRFLLRLDRGLLGESSPALVMRLIALTDWGDEQRSRIIIPIDQLDAVLAGLAKFKASIGAAGTEKEYGW